MDSKDEQNIKRKKEQQKEDSRLAGKYLKAKYNSKIGYRFTAFKYYIHNNSKKLAKRFNITFIIIIIILCIASIMLYANGKTHNDTASNYKAKTAKLQDELNTINESVDKQEVQIEDYSVSTESEVVRASNLLTKLFNGMYNYNNGDEYAENRSEAMDLFSNPKASWIDRIYSTDKDDDDTSIIDNLGLTSELIKLEMFSKDIDDITGSELNVKALVRYQSYIDGVSSDYSTRTHEALYEIKINSKSRKIDDVKKINSVKVLNDIE